MVNGYHGRLGLLIQLQIFDSRSRFQVLQVLLRIIRSGGVEPLKLPPQSPNLNSYSERWVLSIKSECISGLVFFGEKSLLRALKEYTIYYHEERNHQGKDNRLLFPIAGYDPTKKDGRIECRSRLGGVLKYYYREAV